jgi:hypothetical protein
MTSADTARQHMTSAAFAHLSQDDTWSAVGQSLADLLVGYRQHGKRSDDQLDVSAA